jgi:hypothetical protein
MGKLNLNISSASGIPDSIVNSIQKMENEITGDWRLSVISDPHNDTWTLRASTANGDQRVCHIDYRDQNSYDIKRALAELLSQRRQTVFSQEFFQSS